jgi:hypothetical protein
MYPLPEASREILQKSFLYGFQELHKSLAGQIRINYVYQTDSCSYLAQVKPYIDGGKVHDSATLAAFYDGMSKGMLKGAKGTMLRKDSIEIGALKAIELEYVRGDEHSLPVTVCSRALLVNGQVIVYSFTAPTSRYERMKGAKDKFLSSITFNKDSVLIQYHPKLQGIVVT